MDEDCRDRITATLQIVLHQVTAAATISYKLYR